MHPNCITYPVVQVRPYGLLAYDRREYFGPTGNREGRAVKPPRNLYTGELTPYARARCKRALNLLVAIAQPKEAINFKTGKHFKFRLNFVTLTLSAPQGHHTDKEIKTQLLDVWLKRARRIFKLKHYVWRAERQLNGNIHFHIVTDCYMHFEKLRNSWNEVQNRLGFIDQFEAKHGHTIPNSTDVHSLRRIKNLAAYFVKYMTKGQPTIENTRAQVPFRAPTFKLKANPDAPPFTELKSREFYKINGKLWDCSLSLKSKENCELLLETEALATYTAAVEDPGLRVKHMGHCSIVFLEPQDFDHYVTGILAQRWEEYKKRIREKVPISNNYT